MAVVRLPAVTAVVHLLAVTVRLPVDTALRPADMARLLPDRE